MKNTLKILIILFAITAVSYLTGCGGADEEVTEDTRKIKDSLNIYLALENGRIKYTDALLYNEKSDSPGTWKRPAF